MFSAHKMQADSVSKTTSSHDFVSCVSLCFHVERWPRLVIWRMDSRKNGDRKRIYKPKVPNCLSRFWYFAELVSSPIVTSLSFWFVISIHLRINGWLSCFFMTGMQKILKILRVNILSQGRTWLLTYFTNGLRCDFKKLCNWIIFSVFIF